MEHSSSSKVTVEYHDPSGVFPLIARELANRLPLRNLNWQSAARPLRQIKHLHVEFVPDVETEAILRPTPSKDVDRPNSLDILRVGATGGRGRSRERRHQIPGLKTTPYLRLYILRCDDKNWYKQEERAKLKTWVRDIVPADVKQEQHDAFQWLIVHVVIPDTIAASEPRWRESTRDPDELKERSKGTNAKWPGKAPKSVFDRLRADFNDGKLEGNHIAQIRLSKSQVSVDLLPVPALAKTLEETAEEREKSWSDLMTKIRTAILTSFDARVRQYETDTAEQEARQTMPGFNFCTFFIHKEGLARALESVGLLEDALTIYDELALGLETIIVDLASGAASQTATSFPPTGSEVVDRILGSKQVVNGVKDDSAQSSRRLFNKDYRSEIVRSAISVFDFFCYLFERQTALILRLAGRSSSARSESGIRESGEDLVMLAEICWRGLSFIHNAARTLKQDLAESNRHLSVADVHSLVTSWVFSVADFVLERTHSSHLDLTDDGIKTPGKLANGHTASPRKDFGFSMGADAHPARTSSLPAKKTQTRAAEVRSEASTSSTGRISEDGVFSPPSSSAGDELRPEIPGLAELGAYRAELVILKRKMLEDLAKAKGWSAGWASIHHGSDALSHLSKLFLDGNVSTNGTHEPSNMVGVDAAKLIATKEAFLSTFESLTETAIRHFMSATHAKSAEKLMGDLAILKYHEQDFVSAEQFFEHASPLYKSSGWSYLDALSVTMRIECLEKLGRLWDALLCAASLVARHVDDRQQQRPNESQRQSDRQWSLADLIARSKGLGEKVTLQLLDFFTELGLPHLIKHFDDKDGFTYTFTCNHNFEEAVTIDEVCVRLVSAIEESQEIVLRTTHPVVFQPGSNTIEVCSSITTLGQYLVDSIDFKAQQLIFTRKLGAKPASPLMLTQATTEEKDSDEARPSLLIFPSEGSLDAEIVSSRTTALHKARFVQVLLDSGRNDITSLDIKLKPASAGLRIHSTDIKLAGIDLRQDSSFRTGIIQLGRLDRNNKASVLIRVSLEQMKSELSVKAEINYRTAAGDFCFLTDAHLPTQLPIDVEVHDVFYQDTLISTFVIRTVDGLPMLLTDVSLHGTAAYSVVPPPTSISPALVLPTLPVTFAFQVRRSETDAEDRAKEAAMLELALNCISARDAVRETLVQAFDTQLKASSFKRYRRLLLSVMVRRFQHAYTPDDFSTGMLLNETKVPSFADFGWFEVIDTLPLAEQRPLSDWLMRWHIEHQRIVLDAQSLAQTVQQEIAIAVGVPNRDYIFRVTLDLTTEYSSPPFEIGRPLHVQLKIKASTAWMRSKIETLQDFVYELAVQKDIWMLGGQRRARFSIGPGSSEQVTQLTLVPLRAGIHALPMIDIQPVPAPAEPASEPPKALSCETNIMYAGEVYEVLHDRRRTTHIAYEEENR